MWTYKKRALLPQWTVHKDGADGFTVLSEADAERLCEMLNEHARFEAGLKRLSGDAWHCSGGYGCCGTERRASQIAEDVLGG